MNDPAACNTKIGEELIAAYAEGIALELQEIMNEKGFPAQMKKG